MTGNTKPPSRPGGKRTERMAKALRANLQRRKQQLRGRAQPSAPDKPQGKTVREPDRSD